MVNQKTKKKAAAPAKKIVKKATVKAKPAPKAAAQKITKDMTLGEIVSKYPQTAMVMYKYGLHCIGCHVSAYETVEQGCLAHGIPPEDIDKMVKEMNAAISK